jgi:flagellar hook-basal body complex protein FliE
MSVPAVGGAGGVNLSQLAAMYRQQVIDGTQAAASPTSTAASTAASTGASTGAERAASGRGADFGSSIGDGLREVEQLDRTASDKAVQAATGDLTDVHDYVIAATQAQLATELTTTVRNKALDAFNDIMRMPL